MAYIYRKIIGGKLYYYLRISQRIDGKLITRDIAYLGNSVSTVEKKLSNLPKYQKEIRKSYKTIRKTLQSEYFLEQVKKLKIKKDEYFDKETLEKIEAAKLHYNKEFLKHDKTTIEESYKHFLIEFAFNSTSIEGNTITLKEADRLLQEEILPKNKSLREVYDLKNTQEVFFGLLSSINSFTDRFIINIHDRLMDKIDTRKGYRTHDIRVFKSRFKTSPVKYVEADMNIFLKFMNMNKKNLHPLIFAAIFHHKMEKIHPFADGNGRTGRMIINHFLMQNKYPPLIVSKKRRADYLDALSSADKADLENIDAKHYKRLVKFLAEELLNSYWNNFNI